MNLKNLASSTYWKRLINGWLLAVGLLGSAWGQSPAPRGPVPVLSLDTVLTRIDQHNPLLRPFGSRAAAARAYAEGARSWMAPMVGVGTFMGSVPHADGNGRARPGLRHGLGRGRTFPTQSNNGPRGCIRNRKQPWRKPDGA